jgi:predicted transcriptional regulator
MPRVATTPVQIRLPDTVNAFLAQLAAERHESKTQIVIEALDLLRDHLLAERMAQGYADVGASQLDVVTALADVAVRAFPE